MDDVSRILDDHEDRIRKLEEQSTTMMIRLANIEKGQAELKSTIYETSKENQALTKQMLNQLSSITDRLLCGQDTNRKNSWELLFKLWAVLGPVLGAGLGYIFKK